MIAYLSNYNCVQIPFVSFIKLIPTNQFFLELSQKYFRVYIIIESTSSVNLLIYLLTPGTCTLWIYSFTYPHLAHATDRKDVLFIRKTHISNCLYPYAWCYRRVSKLCHVLTIWSDLVNRPTWFPPQYFLVMTRASNLLYQQTQVKQLDDHVENHRYQCTYHQLNEQGLCGCWLDAHFLTA